MSRPPDTSTPGQVADYPATVTMLRQWAAVLVHVDLEAILAKIAQAEALGPMVAPDMYAAAGKVLREDRQLIEAARRLRSVGILQQLQGPPPAVH